jgi:phosphatidylserine decarboxylase
MSRLWGYLNPSNFPCGSGPWASLRLYDLAFGCNLNEIEPSDLRQYASLGDLFYRKLKNGVSPIDAAWIVRRV